MAIDSSTQLASSYAPSQGSTSSNRSSVSSNYAVNNTEWYQDSKGNTVARDRITKNTIDNNRETTNQSKQAKEKGNKSKNDSQNQKQNTDKASETSKNTNEQDLNNSTDNAKNGTDGSSIKETNDYTFENGSTELFKMGRVHRYSNDVDKNGRIINYMRSKMTIVDLIPCTYKLNLNKADTAEGVSGFLPQVEYASVQKEYKKQCQAYGLKEYAGIRVYSTDDTTAAESISHTRSVNVFEDKVNQAFAGFEQIRQMTESIDAKLLKNLGDKYAPNIIATMQQGASDLSGSPELGQALGNLAKFAVDKVLTGRRVAFPSIWSSSDYMPNLSASLRLCSPYGHPKAIKEFIIQPLMYLLILAAPRTADGVSFGRPYTMTIHAYGMAYNPIGYIRNISIRRGGNDTSFNLFRQPLTVDVTLDFDYLVHGFAAFEGDANQKEKQLYNDADKFLNDADVQGGERVCLPTLSHIIKSLRPLKNPFGDPEKSSNTQTADNEYSTETGKKEPNSEMLADAQNAQATSNSAKESVNDTVETASNNDPGDNFLKNYLYGADGSSSIA